MNSREKILLLSELFEVDVSKHIKAILDEIENSEHYKKLVINVEMATKYQVPYTEKFLKEYEELSINKITSIRDAFIARAKIDYLYFISQPKYFINPIMFNPMEMATDITTIGELPCYYHNKEMTINKLVVTEEITSKEKIKTINDVVDKWTYDARDTIVNVISEMVSKTNKFAYRNKNKTPILKKGLIFPLLIILGNIIFFITLFSSLQIFQTILLGTYITSYAALFFTIFLFLFEGWELLYLRMEKNYFSEKQYCFMYLKSHAYFVSKNLDDAVFKIKNAILEAIKNKTEVSVPITKVNYLSNFRRIILYLKSDRIIESKEFKESTIHIIYVVRIMLLVLFILSMLFYLFMLIYSILNGGVI